MKEKLKAERDRIIKRRKEEKEQPWYIRNQLSEINTKDYVPLGPAYYVLLATKKDVIVPSNFFESIALEFGKSTVSINFSHETTKTFQLDFDRKVKIAEVKRLLKQQWYQPQRIHKIMLFSGQKGRFLSDNSNLMNIVEDDIFYILFNVSEYKKFIVEFKNMSELLKRSFDSAPRVPKVAKIPNLSDKEEKLFYLLYQTFPYTDFSLKDYVSIVRRFTTFQEEVNSTIKVNRLRINDLRNNYHFWTAKILQYCHNTPFYHLFFETIKPTEKRIKHMNSNLIIILITSIEP